MTTPDPMTVVYTLTGPNPTFPAGLTTQVGYVVGQAMIDQATGNPSATLIPVGTGPFIYSQWQPNDHFTATRNPNYWRSGLPYLDSITFKPIPDTTQREVDAPVRRGRHDRVRRPHHHHQLLRLGRIRLPAGRQPDRGHRPADLRLHHAEHGRPRPPTTSASARPWPRA